MAKTPLISVIIPNWNGIHHLGTCLDAMRAQTYPEVEVIVVDNASTDGSRGYVETHYPEVCWLQLAENRGFSAAVNAGIEEARGDIIALLNNDTEAAQAWLAELVAALERHSDAGAAASKILLFDRRDTLHTAGDYYRVDGLPGNRGVWQQDDGLYDKEEFVFSACAGAAAFRREVFDAVGLFEEGFFFSGEDVDMGWRSQLAGYKTIYAPRAVVYHHLAATGGDVTASYYNGRNYLWIIARNYPGPLLRRHLRRVIGRQLSLAWEALRAWRGAAARARLKGMLAGIVTLPVVLRQRAAIQATRRVSLEYVDSILMNGSER